MHGMTAVMARRELLPDAYCPINTPGEGSTITGFASRHSVSWAEALRCLVASESTKVVLIPYRAHVFGAGWRCPDVTDAPTGLAQGIHDMDEAGNKNPGPTGPRTTSRRT